MATFDPEQARIRLIKLSEQRAQEIAQRPDIQLKISRGIYDFRLDVDKELQDLEIEVELHGFYLEWTFDQNNNNFEYFCKRVNPDQDSPYLDEVYLDEMYLDQPYLEWKIEE